MSKKHKVTLNLTDEDVEIFTAGMQEEKHKDLAPWIVSVVLRYLGEHQDAMLQFESAMLRLKNVESRLEKMAAEREKDNQHPD